MDNDYKQDFLFGKLFLIKSGLLSIGLRRFGDVVKNVQPGLVVNHVERLLIKSNGIFGITTDSSHDDLGVLLKGIGSKNISKLKIYTSDKVNIAVPYTYCVDIYMTNGIVRVYGNWTDYKDIRFDEVILDMLAPIYKYELNEFTMIDVDELSLHQLDNDYEKVIKAFMAKAGNGESITSRLERLCESFKGYLSECK